ncbi:hypothetical protein [Candidatus Methylobacter oryzae]|uniref:hypothetical protein n=1 Tax=Candidatus Methylobacter oryzae TaxID=2497749 RepID=UPI0012B58FB2|nr:hypothetical protein [Candidatus Methylobacter oryzae]
MNKSQIKEQVEETQSKSKEAVSVTLNNSKSYGDRRKCPTGRRQDRRGFVI